MADLKAREDQLRKQLAELEGRLQRIGTHLEKTPDPDWEDRATEAEMDEVLEGLGSAGTIEVEAIHAALRRIEDGTYGYCGRCGNEISDRRLDILPHTALCRNCAQELSGRR